MKEISKSVNYAKLHLIILGILIITMPYHLSNSWIGTLSLALFLLTIFNNKINIKELMSHRTVMMLTIFIILSLLSFLWSEHIFNHKDIIEHHFDRFKYYFLLIPSIYFSQLTKKNIQLLFKLLVLSPLLYILIYYTNAFNLTHIYSTHYYSTGYKFLYVDLIANIFILFSSLYFYIRSILALQSKEYKSFFILLTLLIIATGALFVDPQTSSRIINLTFFILIILLPLFIIKKIKKILLIETIIILAVALFLLTNQGFKTGFKEFSNASTKSEFQGSWGFRAGLIVIGAEIFQDHPFFGSGTDVYKKILYYQKTQPKYFSNIALTHFHNEHVDILTQIGLFGYIFFLLFLYFLFRLKIESKTINIFKIAFVFLLPMIFFGEQYFSYKVITNTFAILIALFLLQNKLEKNHVETISELEQK